MYARFDKEVAWDDANNRSFVRSIPDPYASVGRADGKTTFVLLAGADTAFALNSSTSPESFTDGVENTILVIAVADAQAVTWSAPQDYVFSRETVQQAMFGKYKDCCYALFGGSTGVRRIPATITDEDLLALITPSGGEVISATDVTRPATPEPDEELIDHLKGNPIVRFTKPAATSTAVATDAATTMAGSPAATSPGTPAEPGAAPVTTSSVAGMPATVGSTAIGGAPIARVPVPTAAEQQFALQALRDLHEAEYEKAETAEAKAELAQTLLAQARSASMDPAGRYVTLQVCCKIALEAGRTDTAMEAMDVLVETFQTDGLQAKADVLTASVGRELPADISQLVLRRAIELFHQAMDADKYDVAAKFQSAALTEARRVRHKELIAEIADLKPQLTYARNVWTNAEKYVETLAAKPDDPAANYHLGAFYCFVKQRWDDGLGMLARGSHLRFKELATLELKNPTSPQQMLALADGWWKAADFEQEHRTVMRSRAAYWYEKAMPGLSPGVERVKAETRISAAATKKEDHALTEDSETRSDE
jgi:hypothetical protein